MDGRITECRCSILDAREEKLLDDEGRVQQRLICNRCGAILDAQLVPPERQRPEHHEERGAAEGAS